MKEASHKWPESYRMAGDASMHTVSPPASKKRKTDDALSQVQISMQQLRLGQQVGGTGQTSKRAHQPAAEEPSIYREFVECSSKYELPHKEDSYEISDNQEFYDARKLKRFD